MTSLFSLMFLLIRMWKTRRDRFGIYKIYQGNPLNSGHNSTSTSDSVIANTMQDGILVEPKQSSDGPRVQQLPLGPLQNYSELAFARLLFTQTPGSVSFSFGDRITHELLGDPLIQVHHLSNLKTAKLHSKIDAWDPYEMDALILPTTTQTTLDL